MFLAILEGSPKEPKVPIKCAGPFRTFEEAAAALPPGDKFRMVMESSFVYGVLAVWEREGQRFELRWESPAAQMVRSRDHSATVQEGLTS